MCKSSVDRIKAEIITSHLKISWSVITGNLESLISLHDNFEWLGKSELNISLQNEDGENISVEISDLNFSEYYDEKAFGVIQTLHLGQNRIKTLYYGFQGLPALFIKCELLISSPLPSNVKFVPLCFNLNRNINNGELKNVSDSKELAILQADINNILLFFQESGIHIDLRKNKFYTVFVGSLLSKNFQNKSIIKFPLMYICPINEYLLHDVYLFHYKIINAHMKYEKWLSEKR